MENHVSAHQYSIRNRKALGIPQKCGCFYCLTIFDSTEIHSWIESEGTALCPRCMIDSVIGEMSGVEISPNFLRKMHDYWF